MDQNEYRKAKESGELVTDAALHETETEIIDDQFEEEQEVVDEVEVKPDDEPENPDDVELDDEPELTPKEKTAFDKRMEREKVKMEEKLRRELEEQTEQKYSKHKQVIESLGGDPDKLLAAAKEAQMQREAQRLADQNGWSEADTQWYVEQQKKDQRLQELEVSVQINDLKDRPEYSGISSMKQSIMDKINASKGTLTVEEAYWALGGPKRIEQIKLEAQQREAAKRREQTRTVITDTPASNTGDKPLPPQVLKEAERMGISAAEARRLMSKEPAQNIDEYRARKVKAN